jgi:hypothetical protein
MSTLMENYSRELEEESVINGPSATAIDSCQSVGSTSASITTVENEPPATTS